MIIAMPALSVPNENVTDTQDPSFARIADTIEGAGGGILLGRT